MYKFNHLHNLSNKNIFSENLQSIWFSWESCVLVRTSQIFVYMKKNKMVIWLILVTLSNMSPRQFDMTDTLANTVFMNQSQVGMSYDFWQVKYIKWNCRDKVT